jgi:hypothetical protein
MNINASLLATLRPWWRHLLFGHLKVLILFSAKLLRIELRLLLSPFGSVNTPAVASHAEK